MIHLYVTPTCLSCRKARAWLTENGLEFEEHNLFQSLLSLQELKTILHLSEEGALDILSVHSKAFQALNVDIEETGLLELFQLIQEHPGLLRRPIIMDDKKMMVGYNEEEIRTFLPREVRKRRLQNHLFTLDKSSGI